MIFASICFSSERAAVLRFASSTSTRLSSSVVSCSTDRGRREQSTDADEGLVGQLVEINRLEAGLDEPEVGTPDPRVSVEQGDDLTERGGGHRRHRELMAFPNGLCPNWLGSNWLCACHHTQLSHPRQGSLQPEHDGSGHDRAVHLQQRIADELEPLAVGPVK